MDAAEKVTKSHAEIRRILQDHDRSQTNPKLFATGEVVKTADAADIYEGLEKDGTATVMNIEMNREMHNESADKKKGGGKGKGGGTAKGKKK